MGKRENKAFVETVKAKGRINLPEAVELAESLGVFGEIDEEEAVEQEKKRIVRGLIAGIRDEDGERILRSAVENETKKRSFFNIPLANKGIIKYLLSFTNAVLRKNQKIKTYLTGRKQVLEGQVSIDDLKQNTN